MQNPPRLSAEADQLLYRTTTATTALEHNSAVLSAFTPTSRTARATNHVLHALTAHTPTA